VKSQVAMPGKRDLDGCDVDVAESAIPGCQCRHNVHILGFALNYADINELNNMTTEKNTGFVDWHKSLEPPIGRPP